MKNRRLVAGALIVTLVLMLAFFSGSEKGDEDALRRPSTNFTDPTGQRGILLACQKLLGSESGRQLRVPFDQMPPKGPDTVLVAGPQRPLEQGQWDAIDDWVKEGGQLILALSQDWELESAAKTHKSVYGELGLKLEGALGPSGPCVLENGKDLTVWARRGSTWKGKRKFEPLLRSRKDVLAIVVPHDKGRYVLIPDAGFFSNKALESGDNGVWLLQTVAAWGNGKIFFDEFHLGFGERAGLTAMIFRFLLSPWGWAFLEWSLLFLIYTAVVRKRLGRPIADRVRPERNPLLLAEARAGLLEAAHATPLALDQICQNLAYHLRDRAGRSADLRALYTRLAGQEGRRATAEKLEALLTGWEKSRAGKPVSVPQLVSQARLACEIREEVLSGRES